jgi:VanZ family protein
MKRTFQCLSTAAIFGVRAIPWRRKSVSTVWKSRRGVSDESFMSHIKQSRFLHNLYYGGPVLAYAGLIFFLSSLSGFPETVPFFPGSDKMAHLIEYYFFGFLIHRWFSSSDRVHGHWFVPLMTILVGTGYSLLDEWHQSFVPGRDASLFDALFDAAGIVTAVVTYPMILRRIFGSKSV